MTQGPPIRFDDEEWVIIPQYPDYMVSNTGEVYCISRDRIIRKHLSNGYLHVNIRNAIESHNVSIHRLVAFAFVHGHFEGAQVNHMDGVKTNNHSSNLEWVTGKQNVRHAYAMGLNPGPGPQRVARVVTLEELETRQRLKTEELRLRKERRRQPRGKYYE